MRKYSFSKEEKLEILNFYENSHFTLNEVAELYQVDSRTIKDWQNNYLFFGEESLNRSENHNISERNKASSCSRLYFRKLFIKRNC